MRSTKLENDDLLRKTYFSRPTACVLFAGAVIYWFIGQKDMRSWAVQEIVTNQP